MTATRKPQHTVYINIENVFRQSSVAKKNSNTLLVLCFKSICGQSVQLNDIEFIYAVFENRSTPKNALQMNNFLKYN